LYMNTPYFVDCSLMMEVTETGAFIPTRTDFNPYILSPFSTYINYPTKYIDAIKCIFLCYTIYQVSFGLRRIAFQDMFTFKTLT
jgi:hypothetical protein